MSLNRISRPVMPCVCALLLSLAVFAAPARAGMSVPASNDVLVYVSPDNGQFGRASDAGIARLNLSTGRLDTILPAHTLPNISDVEVGGDGFLYVADFDKGVFRVDMNSGDVKPLNVNVRNNHVLSVALEDARHLLVGTGYGRGAGIERVDLTTMGQTPLMDWRSVTPGANSGTMRVAPDGTIYASVFVLDGDDMTRIDPRTGAPTELPRGLPDNMANIIGFHDDKMYGESWPIDVAAAGALFAKDLDTGDVQVLIGGQGSLYDNDPPPVYNYTMETDGDFLANRGAHEIIRYDRQTLTSRVVFTNPNANQLLDLIAPLPPSAPNAIPLPPAALATATTIPALAWALRRRRYFA
jgi:hypothetical protein